MSRAWSFLHTGGMSQFQGNLGYTDRVDRFYEWDSTVANHGRVRGADLAVVRDPSHLLGLGWVELLDVRTDAMKTRLRCPGCRSTGFKRRSSLRPPYRCGRCGREFDRPAEEEIGVTRYVADYGSTWWPLPVEVESRAVDAAYLARAAQHSIREMDPLRLREVLDARGAGPSDDWWTGRT